MILKINTSGVHQIRLLHRYSSYHFVMSFTNFSAPMFFIIRKWHTLSSTSWVSRPPYSPFLSLLCPKSQSCLRWISDGSKTVPTVDSARPANRRSVGRSVCGRFGRRWNSQRGPSDGWYLHTDRPTVRRSVCRSVGLSEIWEEVKSIQRAVKSLREGDTGDKWNRRLVGRSVGRKIGEVNKQNERVWH